MDKYSHGYLVCVDCNSIKVKPKREEINNE